MPQDQLLVRHAKNGINRNDIPWQTDGMDLRALQADATAFLCSFYPIKRNIELCFPYFGKTVCQLASGSTGGISFICMSVINDLPMRDVFCGHLGKLLKQNDGQREISHCQNTTMDFLRNSIYLFIFFIAQPRGADDDMRASF